MTTDNSNEEEIAVEADIENEDDGTGSQDESGGGSKFSLPKVNMSRLAAVFFTHDASEDEELEVEVETEEESPQTANTAIVTTPSLAAGVNPEMLEESKVALRKLILVTLNIEGTDYAELLQSIEALSTITASREAAIQQTVVLYTANNMATPTRITETAAQYLTMLAERRSKFETEQAAKTEQEKVAASQAIGVLEEEGKKLAKERLDLLKKVEEIEGRQAVIAQDMITHRQTLENATQRHDVLMASFNAALNELSKDIQSDISIIKRLFLG